MKRINVSDMIYERIIDDFINDKIDFGEKFVEIDYAEKLNVSRTPLREAIKKLEHEGLIIRLHNGRLKFLDFNFENIIEIYNIRIALENMLIEQCVNNADILEKLYNNVITSERLFANVEYELAREKVKEYSKILYSNLDYHYTVKILSKNNLLLTKIKKRTLLPISRTETAIKEHRQIYEAMVDNDLALAFALNRKHLIGARDILLAVIEKAENKENE